MPRQRRLDFLTRNMRVASRWAELQAITKRVAHLPLREALATLASGLSSQGTRELAERFRLAGHACGPFDADLPLAEKDDTLLRFANGDIQVVFATGAFGMGVDIPDIRGVIHYLIPESLEQYYQAAPR